MIDKICEFLTKRIRKELPDVDDERAEVINYGLQNIIGEIPKIFVVFAVGAILGIFKETVITFLALLIFKGSSGGFHLKTHIGCIITTCTMFCAIALMSKYIILSGIAKYIAIGFVLIFGMIMIKLYAPADTENVPILRKKDRRKKQILAYISLVVAMIIAIFVQDNTIANILIFGHFIQTLTITKLAYKITNNKYGYEVYCTSNETV